jgi:hypothetical protein
MANTIADKVAAITGATADTEFIDMGKKFVVTSLPIEALREIGVDGSAIVNDSGQASPNKIISVRRDGRVCQRVPESLAYAFDLTRIYTITVSDYSTIVAGETITVDEITLTARAAATTEELDFIPETSNTATAQNIADALANITSITATPSGKGIGIIGAKSTSESMTGVSIATTSSTTSLFNSTSLFPKYYIRTGKVFIKPAPTASATGIVTKIDYSDISDDTEFDNIIVHYATAMEFSKLSEVRRDAVISHIDIIMNATTGLIKLMKDASPTWVAVTDPAFTKSMSEALPTPNIQPLDLSSYTTRLQAALDSMIQYIGRDGDNTVQTIENQSVHNAGYWIYDEDSEMSRATVEVAGSELQNAAQEIGHMQALIAEYSNDIQGELGRLRTELDSVAAEAKVYDSESQRIIQSYSAQVTEEAQRVQSVIAEMNAYLSGAQAVSASIQGEIALMSQDLERSRDYYKWAVLEADRIRNQYIPPPQQTQQDERDRR